MTSKNASLLGPELRETAPYEPFLRGRFAVGVQTLEAFDKARNRLFLCEVWYPAAAEHAAQDLDSSAMPPCMRELTRSSSSRTTLLDTDALPLSCART